MGKKQVSRSVGSTAASYGKENRLVDFDWLVICLSTCSHLEEINNQRRTMSGPQNSSKALPQSKEVLLKSYNTRLKDDVKSMLENFDGNWEKYFRFFVVFVINVKYYKQTNYFQKSLNLLKENRKHSSRR
ncbi:MED22 family protein [Megaselia abdita]